MGFIKKKKKKLNLPRPIFFPIFFNKKIKKQ